MLKVYRGTLLRGRTAYFPLLKYYAKVFATIVLCMLKVYRVTHFLLQIIL